MKRLFHLIGIFVALFSVLFFFYLADKKDIITTTENEYTFQLSKYITNYETTIKQNRRRVYYHLEPEGFHQLDQMLKEYQQVIGGIQSILDYSGDVYQKEGKDKR